MGTLIRSAIVIAGLALLVGAPVVSAADSRRAPSSAQQVNASTLLRQLSVASEQSQGYSRDLFRHWVDADGDGCDAREEVLILEARIRPVIGSGCRIIGGRWWSAYDNLLISVAGRLDIDHFVPLAEAWRSGARRWTAATRMAFANDLEYPGSLIAVTARTNRSKSDRDPSQWRPAFGAYRCTYMATWIAVKWRWRLTIDAVEKGALTVGLVGCSRKSFVLRPSRAAIFVQAAANTPPADESPSESSGSSSPGALDPRFPYCNVAIAANYGPYVQGKDPEYAWYRDGDRDGIVCER